MAGGFFAVQAAGDGGGNGLCSGSGCGAFFEAAAVHLGEEAAQYGMAEQLDSLVGMAAVLAEGITDNLSGIGGGGVGSGLLGALPAEIAGDEGGHGTEGAGFAAAGFPLGDVLFGLCPALQGVLYAGFIVVGCGDFEIFVCLIAGGNVFPDLPADVGLYAAADVGGGFGHDLLPLQYGFEIGQRFGLSMGGGGVTVDADFLGGGIASADVEDTVAESGVGGALALPFVVLRQGSRVAEITLHAAAGSFGGAGEGVLAAVAGVVGFAAVAGAEAGAVGAVAAVSCDVLEGEAVGGELVLLFGGSGGDGAAFEVDAVGLDVVAAVAGKQAALLADAAAVAFAAALVVVGGNIPGGAPGYLNAQAAAGLFALLVEAVLRAFDGEFAADVGVDAPGVGLGAVEGGVAAAFKLDLVGLQDGGGVVGGVEAVVAFTVAGFGVDINAERGAEGDANADLDAGIAVFAVGMADVLPGLEQDVAGGIEAQGVGGLGLGALQPDVAFAAVQADVFRGQSAALVVAVAVVLLFAGSFEAEAGFNRNQGGALLFAGAGSLIERIGFGGFGHFADGIIQLVALGAGGQSLQGAGAVVGFALGGAFGGVDQVDQRGGDFGEGADFDVAFGLVAAAGVVGGADVDALGADVNVFAGDDVAALLAVGAAGIDGNAAVQAAELALGLDQLAGTAAAGVFHPAAEVLGVGDHGAADAAADLGFAAV